MKRFTLNVILFIAIGLTAVSQSYPVSLTANLLKDYEGFKKGESVSIDSVGQDYVRVFDLFKYTYYVTINGKRVSVNNKIGDRFKFDYKSVGDIWDAEIISSVLTYLNKKGDDMAWRKEVENDALQYLHHVQDNQLNDPYLENYMYSLISKISPSYLVDGRPGNVNIVILESPEINAFTFPNGTIVIYTGLLSILHSEDELAAILCHEIAHFVLDHSYQNYTQEVSRKKRAEFWAAVATGVAAVGDAYLASKNTYYQPGTITLATAMAASEIASEVINRSGMKYNHEQELEADKLANKVLCHLGYEHNALATALARIRDHQRTEHTNVSYLESYTHPSLDKRICENGIPNLSMRDVKFEQMLSFAISSSAILKYSDRRFKQAYELAVQNINNKVGIADDYLIAANCLMCINDDVESNQIAYDLIQQARNLDAGNINYFKADILALLRLGKNQEAIAKLGEYHKALDEMKQSLANIYNQDLWHKQLQFIDSNQEWAHQMSIKLNGMNMR